MPFFTRITASITAALCLSSFAFAAPPVAEDNADVLMEKIEDKLSDHKVDIAKSTARLKRKMERAQDKTDGDIGENLDVVADIFEEAFAKDGVFRDVAALLSDFATDIDVDTDDDKTVLRFDGAEVAQIQRLSSRDSEDLISISGLGKNLTFDRKTVVENGKSKTRIVIEMDGEDEIDITIPTP